VDGKSNKAGRGGMRDTKLGKKGKKKMDAFWGKEKHLAKRESPGELIGIEGRLRA